MRTIAVIQARLGSTRLKGKALAEIAGKPMIEHVVERASLIPGIAGVCLAIPSTDPRLADYAKGHYVVTGPEEDVLTRFMIAAEITNAERIIRITGDCPLLDPAVAAAVMVLHDTEPFRGYVSNVWPRRTWPDGLDVEVFTVDELAHADKISRTVGYREHVTPLMRKPDSPNLEATVDLGRFKWSVDTPVELGFVRRVMEELPSGAFRMADTLEAIRKADLWSAQPESDDWRKLQ